MRSAKITGRIIGGLLVVQLAGLMVPFILLHPLQQPPGFLQHAAPVSFQIRVAVLLFFANCALTIAITIIALPVFRQFSQPMAISLFAASIIMFLLQTADNVHLLSMVSLSQQYASAGSRDSQLFQAAAIAVGEARKWTHYSELLAIDAWMLLFYGLALRSAIVPRALALLALLTVVLHTTGISLPLLLGSHAVMALGVPMAFGQLAVATWLLAKGFRADVGEVVN